MRKSVIIMRLSFWCIVVYSLLFFIMKKSLSGSVIVKPHCGIGSQLFQFAASYSLAKATGGKLYVIEEGDKDSANNSNRFDRSYILNRFNINDSDIEFTNSALVKFGHWLALSKFSGWVGSYFFGIKVADERSFFEHKKLINDGFIAVKGYFESELYFKEHKLDILSKLLHADFDVYKTNPKINNIVTKISKNNSVCVHVRRGDFLKKRRNSSMLTIAYQKEAIKLAKHLIKDPEFFIFADSIEFAKKELEGVNGLNFVEEELFGLQELFVISKCGNYVTSNSKFNWWAAYLNHNIDKLVIAPRYRYNENLYKNITDKDYSFFKRSLNYSNVNPKEWVLLDTNKNAILELLNDAILDHNIRNDIRSYYKNKYFDIYTGDLNELDLCKNEAGKFKICRVNIDDKNSKKPTVISSYYKAKSILSVPQYDDWVRAFMKIPFNLVMYTDKYSEAKLRSYRGNLPMKLIVRDIVNLEHYKFHNEYKKMYLKDNNKQHSPELYVIWAEKIKFVMDAIEKDYYSSDFFVWCDSSIFRDLRYLSYDFPKINRMIHGKISFAVTGDFENYEKANKLLSYGGNVQRIASNLQVGDKFTWKLYNVIWDKTLNDMISHEIDVSNDQRVMGTIAIRYPELINLIYPSINYHDNKLWYSLKYFTERSAD